MWSEAAQKQFQDQSDEDESDEESDSDGGAGPSGEASAKSREDRKKEKKARKDAAIAKKRGQAVEVGDMPSSSEEDSDEDSDDEMPVNPNHTKAARTMAKSTPNKEVDETAEGVKALAVAANRKERESQDAAAAKARYQKLHEQGKTDEAKADLARLKLIREQRETEAARRAVCYRPVLLLALGVGDADYFAG
jgi:hypothetical protein